MGIDLVRSDQRSPSTRIARPQIPAEPTRAALEATPSEGCQRVSSAANHFHRSSSADPSAPDAYPSRSPARTAQDPSESAEHGADSPDSAAGEAAPPDQPRNAREAASSPEAPVACGHRCRCAGTTEFRASRGRLESGRLTESSRSTEAPDQREQRASPRHANTTGRRRLGPGGRVLDQRIRFSPFDSHCAFGNARPAGAEHPGSSG